MRERLISFRKYTNGAVGSLLHAIALHGINYSIELQVYADGVSSTSVFVSWRIQS